MFKGAVIVMGVTSCGKTSVGEGLAKEFDCPFIEGDHYIPAANIAEILARETPLNDTDRWPWLEAIGKAMKAECEAGRGVVAACSALQEILPAEPREATNEGQSPSFFLHGSRELLAARMAARKGHFMPTSLLDSQLATI